MVDTRFRWLIEISNIAGGFGPVKRCSRLLANAFLSESFTVVTVEDKTEPLMEMREKNLTRNYQVSALDWRSFR